MTIDKRILIGGVAAIALLGIATGFVAARMSGPHGAGVAEGHDEEHEEAEHEPGFVALKPEEAAAFLAYITRPQARGAWKDTGVENPS